MNHYFTGMSLSLFRIHVHKNTIHRIQYCNIRYITNPEDAQLVSINILRFKKNTMIYKNVNKTQTNRAVVIAKMGQLSLNVVARQ